MLAALALFPALSRAQDACPARTVTIVVPFPAGNTGDVLWRTLGQELSREWGKSVVVDNKRGSGGAVGAQVVMRSPPDGYTLLHGSSGPIAIGPHLNVQAGQMRVLAVSTPNQPGPASAFPRARQRARRPVNPPSSPPALPPSSASARSAQT